MDESLETYSASDAAFAASAGAAAPSFLTGLLTSVETISRATSPGLPCGEQQHEDDKKRYRPRTFSYFRLLPFDVEDDSHRDAALRGILKNLYTAIMAEDFSPGALHWTRELQGWLNLKFEMTRDLRARLARLYYHLALAPGLDTTTADRFSRMVITLTRSEPLPLPLETMFSVLICLRLQKKALPQARRGSYPRLAAVVERTKGVGLAVRGRFASGIEAAVI